MDTSIFTATDIKRLCHLTHEEQTLILNTFVSDEVLHQPRPTRLTGDLEIFYTLFRMNVLSRMRAQRVTPAYAQVS